MPETLTINSHKGPYSVFYSDTAKDALQAALIDDCHILVDKLVLELYRDQFAPLLDGRPVIEIEATEEAKTIDEIVPVMEQLVSNGLKRNQTILAIGGGVLQDITCFIASVMMRGVTWRFVPTTLLAQADSCIGSKSSVNLKAGKNILGTFYPPDEIHVSTLFLDTLPEVEVRSGIGEIIKVHAIDGAESYDYLTGKFSGLMQDTAIMNEFIDRSLRIKKGYIEVDEFDKGPRNIFNFGHSFGHAIETATKYGVPHGIAVTLGMKIALDFAVEMEKVDASTRDRMKPILLENAGDYVNYPIESEAVFRAMSKDKKNISNTYRIIVPVGADAKISPLNVPPDEKFLATLQNALADLKA